MCCEMSEFSPDDLNIYRDFEIIVIQFKQSKQKQKPARKYNSKEIYMRYTSK